MYIVVYLSKNKIKDTYILSKDEVKDWVKSTKSAYMNISLDDFLNENSKPGNRFTTESNEIVICISAD